MRLKVSQAAADDLEDIWLYTVEHWSVKQADKYVGLILAGFSQIQDAPFAGKDCSHIRDGYFSWRVKSHLIYYKPSATQQQVEVIRVLHERMDIPHRLKG